jgi:MFS family permease
MASAASGPAETMMAHEWTPKVRRPVIIDGVFSKLMDTFTGGVVLAGLGVYLGASNFLLGLLASLPFLAQVAQLPTVQLLMRITDRRRVVVIAVGVGRTILLVIAALLIFARPRFGPELLLVLIAVMALLSVVAAAAWNWWMRDLVPRSELGRFFGNRARITTIYGCVALVSAGAVLDWFQAQGAAHLGYALLFALGGLMGWCGVYYLGRTEHPAPHPRPPGRALDEIRAVVRSPEHRALVVALSLVATTLTVALPFTAVFLLRTFAYSFVAITGLALVSQLAYLASLRGWGHLSDRFGNRPVLQISVGLLTTSLIGWTFAGGRLHWALFPLLVVLHFLAGYAVGGIDLTAANIMLKTAPDQGAPAYFAAISLTRAFAAGAATVLAGAAWQALGSGIIASIPIAHFRWDVYGFHALSLASAALGLFAVLSLRRVREPGGVAVHDVARAMRREVHLISSVAGIRAFVHVVSYVVEFIAGPPREPAPEAGPSSGALPKDPS